MIGKQRLSVEKRLQSLMTRKTNLTTYPQKRTNMAIKKMNKTIYVAGKVYDLATMSSQEIQDDVQSRLDNHL